MREIEKRIARLEEDAVPPSTSSPSLPSEIWLSAPGGNDTVLLWRRNHENH